jgi:hypothetical protein
MAGPTNVSLKGIIDWSQQANGGDGHPLENDINADRVDGKHYADLKNEWEVFAQSAGGGGCVAFGDSTFVGNSSYRTITFTPDLGAINYVVSVMPTANTSSYVGEIWWTKVSGASFRVYNAGSGTTAFRWAVMLRGQMPDLAGNAGGDLTGTYPNPTIAQKGASTGQVLTWNGSSWAPGTVAAGGGANPSGLTDVSYTAKVVYSKVFAGSGVDYVKYTVHLPTATFGYYHSFSGGNVNHAGPGVFTGIIPGDSLPYLINPIIYRVGVAKDTACTMRDLYTNLIYSSAGLSVDTRYYELASHNITYIGGVSRQACDFPPATEQSIITPGNYSDSITHDIFIY